MVGEDRKNQVFFLPQFDQLPAVLFKCNTLANFFLRCIRILVETVFLPQSGWASYPLSISSAILWRIFFFFVSGSWQKIYFSHSQGCPVTRCPFQVQYFGGFFSSSYPDLGRNCISPPVRVAQLPAVHFKCNTFAIFFLLRIRILVEAVFLPQSGLPSYPLSISK